MSSQSFFKSKRFLLGLIIILGAAVAVYFLMMPRPGYTPKPTTENCITLSKNDVRKMLRDGWRDAANSNYIPSLLFYTSTTREGLKVTAYPTTRDTARSTSRATNARIGTSDNAPPCALPTGLTADYNRYDLTDADADASGQFKFDFIRLKPIPFPEDPSKLCFQVEMVTVTDGEEVATLRGYTKPCPPLCPVKGEE